MIWGLFGRLFNVTASYINFNVTADYYSGEYQFDGREKPIFNSRVAKFMFRSRIDLNFVILVEYSDTDGPSLMTVWMEYLFVFQFSYCELYVGSRWEKSTKHYFVDFCSLGVRALIVSGWGLRQKVSVGAIWNRIFLFLFFPANWLGWIPKWKQSISLFSLHWQLLDY